MSFLGDLTPGLLEDGALSSCSIAEPQIAGCKKVQESNSAEDQHNNSDEEEDQQVEEEEEVTSSGLVEPSTLSWPREKGKIQTESNDGDRSEDGASEPEERDTGFSGGSLDLLEERSQDESDTKCKAKWRESMPEGERWRDSEIGVQGDNKRDGSLADEEVEGKSYWITEKASLGFTPQVKIVHLSSKELPEESRHLMEKDAEKQPQVEPNSAVQFYSEWPEQEDKYYVCEHLCSEKLKLAVAMLAAGLLFPLLVWGGYNFLPFDSPLLESSPLRVVYTLRCSFFATIPILLGVVVQGMARLRYSTLKPLYQNKVGNIEVAVHWHYVNESLALFLFYFLQLAVMATYISQDQVKVVPLLTIIFVFGRLIYWLCLSLGSSIRGFGFGFSFFPILVMLGTNLYYICSSVGQGAVFDVAPPTTAPPPRQRWWG